jgi:hypothetical protein
MYLCFKIVCIVLIGLHLLEHLHSLGLPTPKSGDIVVRIGGKFGVGRASFPTAIPGLAVDLVFENVNLTKYGKNLTNFGKND